MHKRDAHLRKIKDLGINTDRARFNIPVETSDRAHADDMLGIFRDKPFVIVSPGAKSHIKRWPLENYADLSDLIKEKLKIDVVLIGDGHDRLIINKMTSLMNTRPLDISGKTNMREIAYLVRKARLLITNDSAPLHVASAVGTPVLVFFGPTDEKKYGPSGEGEKKVLRKSMKCAPCEVAECAEGDNEYTCMSSISVEEAFNAVKELLV